MASYDTHIVDGKRFNIAWTKIKELFANTSTAISDVATNLSNLSTAVDYLSTNTVAGIRTDLDNLSTSVTDLSTGTITSLTNTVNQLSTSTIPTLEQNYTNLYNLSTAMQEDINTLQTSPTSTFTTITLGTTTLTEAQLIYLLSTIPQQSGSGEE